MRGSAPEDEKSTARPALRRSITVAAAALLLLPLASATPSAGAAKPGPDALQRAFTQAADRYHVPRSVLLGVSYLESRWDEHGGAPSVSGGYGPMHLTDARTALSRAPEFSGPDGDARGDGSRAGGAAAAARAERAALPAELPARLRTLRRAAELTGLSPQKLRTDPAANVLGGAALLAAEQRSLGRAGSADPARWYAAVARYGGEDSREAGAAFANDVYAVMRQGQSRMTDAGQLITLAAAPGLRIDSGQANRAGLRQASAAGRRAAPGDPGGPWEVECPWTVACESVPAPYEEFGDHDYGNHDLANRPRDQRIDTIVIHDTEGSWETTLRLIKDPKYVSWHYTVRSSDGLIAQHVPTKDVGWHAGNWYVNSHSVGVEHEGFLASPDAWYTEAMYRTSARLVRYLSRKYDIPLDRQHIIGHDNVPGTTTATIKGMHTDPGPYWDWDHYFTLLGAPFKPNAGPSGGLVTIRPDYDRNRPQYTGCAKPGQPCPSHGSTAVRLHTAPDERAPLVRDIGLHPDGSDSTIDVNDTGARASTGQRFAVADRAGDWTAIWYLGQKAWFRNPDGARTAVNSRGLIATPKDGRPAIPVYGRAYPEQEAYPPGVPYQAVSPLPYTLLAGQKYAVGDRVRGDYFYSPTFDVSGHAVVRGEDVYYEIQLGHRVGYVRAADVDIRPSDA